MPSSSKVAERAATAGRKVNFGLPKEVTDYLHELDGFIEREIKPLQMQNDNMRFFDHRREDSRTDWHRGGLPNKEWEELLSEMRRRADKAGHLRFALPRKYGGRDGGNLAMAAIREHLAAKGLGLHNDLQNEASIVGNIPTVWMFDLFGTEKQKQTFINGMFTGETICAFGLTEPAHGSDATWMETKAVQDSTGNWILDGEKTWNTGVHVATHDLVFARTHGKDGDAFGITCFIVPMDSAGVNVEEYLWTFNMPTDHARVSFQNVKVPKDMVLGEPGKGLAVAQCFLHENRIRQAASGIGAAQYCVDEAVKYSLERKVFGQPLARKQAIQWPLIELQSEIEAVRLLIYKTASLMDQVDPKEYPAKVGHLVSMCNYRANRLVCEAADQAMQVHGGLGYSRHKQFEHIYRHHRRYRITEGSEEIQKRRVGAWLFGYIGEAPWQNRSKL
eukprot:Clim_evm58s243 gene=Clim_evmTU58s243